MWFWLVVAVASEVTATVALRQSDGFSRLLPTVVVGVGYLVAFLALSQALVRGMSLGTAYALWAGAGVALVALIGAVFLGEHLTQLQVLGIALVVAGAISLELGGSHAA